MGESGIHNTASMSGGAVETASRKQEPKASQPLVAVVIPCYKQAHFLGEAIGSVLHQTFHDWELIVVDDGSPDDVMSVVQPVHEKWLGNTIRILKKDNSGLPSARNAGIRATQAPLVLVLDADDRVAPRMLECAVPVLQKDPDVGFVYSHIQHFGDRTDLFPLPEFDAHSIVHVDNSIAVCALLRRSMWEQVGGYNECMREGYEDWDFWVSCIQKGWKGHRIAEPLFYYRVKPGSMLKDANAKRGRLIASIVKNHPVMYSAGEVAWAESQSPTRKTSTAGTMRPLNITYLSSSLRGLTGGNLTVLNQANALAKRGHRVTLVSRTGSPVGFPLRAEVIIVPEGKALSSAVPPSDAVISTYFLNTPELLNVDAPLRIYFAQGDQFLFDPRRPEGDAGRLHDKLRELSKSSYLLPNVTLLANSRNLASTVQREYGRMADGLLPVCVDQTVFRPLQKTQMSGKRRVLIVGPDVNGSEIEPLDFKGMADIRAGLELLLSRRADFTAVRISSTSPDIFRGSSCEFYIAPSNEMKTFLFGSADILVYASHYDSCPRPPLEAMAAGVAVVCTATDGAKEYCIDGRNSLLVPVRSPSAIAEAVARLLDDDDLRQRIATEGYRMASQFPQEREWDELEAFLATRLPGEPLQTPGHSLMERALNAARASFAAGDYAQAMQAMRGAEPLAAGVSSEDERTALLASMANFLGTCATELGWYDEAKEHFEHALQAHPGSSLACGGLGEVFFRKGFPGPSKTMFEWAVKNDPSDTRAGEGLARANAALALPATHNSLISTSTEDEAEGTDL